MKDKQSRLDQLLRTLPRERASGGFRDKVLRAARQAGEWPQPWYARSGHAMVLAAAAMALALGLSLSLYMVERGRRAELRREIAELKLEHRRLDAEVDQLRGDAARFGAGGAGRRVIYLGGDDTVDYVLDLERLARQGMGQRLIQAVQPVSPDDVDIEVPWVPGTAPYSGGAL